MNFKFFKGNETPRLYLQPYPTFNPQNVEFCFQFNNENPVVFASGPNECNISLRPQSNANMTFTDNGNQFKLFAREKIDE